MSGVTHRVIIHKKTKKHVYHSAGKRDRDLTPSPYNARRAESPVERAKRAVRSERTSEASERTLLVTKTASLLYTIL